LVSRLLNILHEEAAMDEFDAQAAQVATRFMGEDRGDARLLHDLEELAVEVLRDLRRQCYGSSTNHPCTDQYEDWPPSARS
jgi:hypothetical protein